MIANLVGRLVGWTAADAAELDVLLHALTAGYEQHRAECPACQPCAELQEWREHKADCRICDGMAPLTYGWNCPERHRFLEHNRRGCSKCLPCPSVQRAVAEVMEWRDARILLSRAQALRAELEERAA